MTTLAAIIVPLVFVAAAPESEFPVYVGQAACLKCHASSGPAAPCSEVSVAEHDASYASLSKSVAAEIAVLSGVAEQPTENRICLSCHATGADEGRRWWAPTFHVEGGVQCESCHNAGSLHVAAESAAVPEPREVRLAESRIRRGDKADCAVCHVDRPSHHEVLDLGFRRSQADHLYKMPVNLAISQDGNKLYVVCEHSDSVFVVNPADGNKLGEVRVGKRPHDAALSPDGRRLFVTNRLSGTVSVVDTEQLNVVGEIVVGNEPHGVLLDAPGKRVYVLNTGSNDISVIDAETLQETRRLVAGRGPWSLAMRPDAAVICVTSVRPNPGRFRDPSNSEVTLLDPESGVVSNRLSAPDANMLQGVAWVPGENVALFTIMRTKNLIPITRAAQGWVITNGLGVLWPDGRIDQVLLDRPDDYFPDPMDVAVSPDGRYALASSGGADEVALIDVKALLDTIRSMTDEQRAEVLPNHLGMSRRFVVKRISVGANPRGVLYSPDGRFAYVANTLNDSVTVIETADYRAVRAISLDGPSEVTSLRRGERLFHSANATYGRQFSCHSCHPDGHTNGLTFDIEADGIGLKPVDNRSLRGIFDTPPFKWEGTNPSLYRQCGPRFAMFFTRLTPRAPDDLTDLVRYMCTIQNPSNTYRRPDGLTITQRRGKAIFDRAATNKGKPLEPQDRCNYCHGGAYGTNRQMTAVRTTMWFDTPLDLDLTDLFNAAEYGQLGAYFYMDAGLPSAVFDAPHLTNIAYSAPYLHNGSSHTLDELWTRFNMVNRHGATADLTRQQLNDLTAYLKSQ